MSLATALSAHRSGDLTTAEGLYRGVIEAEPTNAEAWRLLAALTLDAGRAADALPLIERALGLEAHDPLGALTHGNILMALGRARDAAAAFGRALEGAAAEETQIVAAAETNLGNALRILRRADEALGHCRRGVALAPDLAEAHHNLGAVLLDLVRAREAVPVLRQALALAPGLLAARIDLARGLVAQGDRAAARAEADIAARTQPTGGLANLLGTVYYDLALDETARTLFECALAAQPNDAQALNNLGNVRARTGDAPGAIACYRGALASARDNPTYLANLGGAQQAAGDLAAALIAFERALMVDPSHADARWNRGIARLLTGDLAQGFSDYEARWALPEFAPRAFKPAKWDGGDVGGHTVLLHSEQGFGDTIQMVRFAAAVKARGARVVLETHPALCRLMETAPGVDTVVARGAALPAFDLHVPMMSLPRALRLARLEDIPASVPYLSVRDDARIALPPRAEGALRVGLVWAGRPTHRNDANRSCPIAAVAPLAGVPRVQLFSLQVGERAAELAQVPWGTDVVDLAPQLTDFALTAAAVCELDLVICVDTAVAHLAGALAKPCWLVLPFAPDWRWLLDRADSPWYPTLRLFRQSRPGDWPEVLQRVAAALAERSSAG